MAGVVMMTDFYASVPIGSTTKLLFRTNKEAYLHYLRTAEDNYIIRPKKIKALLFMDYLRQLRNTRTNAYLSRLGYGNRRAALIHLYRLHNKVGYSEEFRVELGNLFKGFYGNLAGMHGEARIVYDGEAVADGDAVAAVGDATVGEQIDFTLWQWNSDESKSNQ